MKICQRWSQLYCLLHLSWSSRQCYKKFGIAVKSWVRRNKYFAFKYSHKLVYLEWISLSLTTLDTFWSRLLEELPIGLFILSGSGYTTDECALKECILFGKKCALKSCCLHGRDTQREKPHSRFNRPLYPRALSLCATTLIIQIDTEMNDERTNIYNSLSRLNSKVN